MARYVYAKIFCDIFRHPLLRTRPDCDKVLAVGLILDARENTTDGVIRGLTADSARRLFNIEASSKKVQAALDYFVTRGWIIPHPGEAYEIKDFIQRQGPDSEAARASRSRDKNRESRVTKCDDNVTQDAVAGVTKRDVVVTKTLVEGDRERDREEAKAKDLPPTAADASAVQPKSKAKKPQTSPEQEACRKAIRDGFESEYLRRSGGAPFDWGPAEHLGIKKLAALDGAGGVDPAKGLLALGAFVERMAVKPYYASNFAPRIVAQEINNMRMEVVADRRGQDQPRPRATVENANAVLRQMDATKAAVEAQKAAGFRPPSLTRPEKGPTDG